MKKIHRISFALKPEEQNEVLLEHLRYASVVGIHGSGHTGHVPIIVKREFPEKNVILTIECPRDLVAQVWVQQNIERMRSFGRKAIYWTA